MTRIGTPATSSSAPVVNPMTSAVPRSGCEAMSRHATPTTISIGLMSPCTVCMRFGRSASSWAM